MDATTFFITTTIVSLLVAIILLFYILRLKNKNQPECLDKFPDVPFRQTLSSSFNYIVYNSDLNIVYARIDRHEIMMDFTRKNLIGINVLDLERYVASENLSQIRLITENILIAAREKKSRYFEYSSVFKENNEVYYAICFVIYQPDGTLATCATVVDAKNMFQAREHLYNNEINPAVGQVSVGIYVRSIENGKRKYELFNLMAQHFFGTSDVLHSPNWNQQEEDRYDEQVLDSDQSVTYEKPVLGNNGNLLRWLQVIKRKREKQDATGCFITTTLLDITQRKKEELELVKTRKNLELAIGAADISIWLYNREKQLFVALYGGLQPSSEIAYEDLIVKMFEPYRTEFIEAFDRLLNGVSSKEVTICRVCESEAYPSVYYSIQMTVAETGVDGRVRSLVGTLKDITYQYIHREELENREKKVQLAIETSDLVQWEYNNLTRLFNSSNERIKNGETVLTREDYVRAVHPDDLEEVMRVIDVMDEGLDEKILLNKRLKYSGDDSWHYTTVYGAPFEKDIDGKVVRYTGFRRDDTEWKNINERLEEEKKKAQQADKLKSAFLANMSHEIRTPLNAIIGFSQLLLVAEDPAEREQYAQIINVNNDLLLRLINDILDLSKIESGMMKLKTERFDLSSFFEDYVTTLRLRITNPKVEFIPVNPYRQCMVELDKDRMAQILTNFATNAIKYTPDGHIKAGYEYVDGGIRIYVEDTGIGISEEKQGRIFQRFEKLDDFAQGTGLGLSICKAIIDAIHGRIGFESQPGKGSTFWAWFACEAEIE